MEGTQEERTHLSSVGGNDLSKYEPKTAYFEHQRRTLVAAYPHDEWGFLMEPGCGKSKTLIDDICIHFEFRGLQLAAILAPKGVYDNWVAIEIPRHMPDRIRQRCIVHMWQGGHSKAEQSKLDFMCEEPRSGQLKILVMNLEAISMSKRGLEFLRRFVSAGRCMVGVDESSKIKNPDAIVTKRLHELRDVVEKHRGWRRILTGTVATRSPMDVWSQFEFLQENYFRCGSFFGFRGRYAVTKQIDFRNSARRAADEAMGRSGRKITVIEEYRNLEELRELMARRCTIVRKADCLDLPPKRGGVSDPGGPRVRHVQMTERQLQLYSDLVELATAEISEGQHITVTHILTKMLRLHQILSGVVVSEDGETTYIDTNLPDALQEELEETEGQTIIWCRYRHDVEMVKERLQKMGRIYVEYHGGVSQPDRRSAIEQFQNGQADVFVGTVDAGGFGITLTAASSVVYYTTWYNLEKRLQSEDRPHRIGQRNVVTYTDLVHPETVNVPILDRLCAQQNLAEFMMTGPAAVRNLLTGKCDFG